MTTLNRLAAVSFVAVALASNSGCANAEDADNDAEHTGTVTSALKMCDPDCYSGDRTEVDATTNSSSVYQQYNSCPSNARAAHNAATMALRNVMGQEQDASWGADVCYKSNSTNFDKLRTFRGLVASGKCKMAKAYGSWKCGEYYVSRKFTCTDVGATNASTLYNLANNLESTCSQYGGIAGISAFFYPKGVTKTTTKTYVGGYLRKTQYDVSGEIDPEYALAEWNVANNYDWTNGRDVMGSNAWVSYIVKWPDWPSAGLDSFWAGWQCSAYGASAGSWVGGTLRQYKDAYGTLLSVCEE
jgi:hypothetical protein